MKLYICATYYHVLITMIKVLISEEKSDLYLFETIPNCAELMENLCHTGCFNNIYQEMIPFPEEKESQHRTLVFKALHFYPKKMSFIRLIEKYAPIDFKTYSEIYLFNDCNHIGQYLIMKRIPFHLVEDALDYYKYFDRYWKVKPQEFQHNSLIYLARKAAGMLRWGQAQCVIDIEVNEIEGIKIPKQKVFAVSRKQLFARLDDAQKLLIYNIFMHNKHIDHGNGKSLLLCTQPLYQDKFVESVHDQLLVFESVIQDFSSEYDKIVIKPHPRDNADYTDIIRRYDCGSIDKTLPTEVLNFDPSACYDAAVSITSTSILFLDFTKEKILLGAEYINKVLNDGQSADKRHQSI